jgi:NAD+ kinase
MTAKPGLRVLLYGAEAQHLAPLVQRHANLTLVEAEPDVVVSYGGDGTLLAAELAYPGLPKVPVLNSTRGHRCIPHPPDEVIALLADGALVSNIYTKLECAIYRNTTPEPQKIITPLNEIMVLKGHVNSAVRYKLWVNGDPYEGGLEILGDGVIVCTPFGSTAYFSKVTRGVFRQGIGVAFMASAEHVSHIVVPEDSVIRLLITRGPAVLAYDNSEDRLPVDAGDELAVLKHPRGATILACGFVRRLAEPF